nr:hypothetical protein B0A51_17844 [Rachicladosporium sp. CCFEE 5018]
MVSTTLRAALAAGLIVIPAAVAQQAIYAQCGGSGYSGGTTCVSGSTCVVVNPYYSQCLPGSASSSSTSSACTTTITISSRVSTTTATTPPSSSTTITTPAPASTTPTKTTTAATTTTSKVSSGGSGPGSTLQGSYLWIRAVEDPNFHKYLQTSPQYTTGLATLNSYTTAGQFNVVNGQLVELISATATSPTLLYANVGQPATPSSSLLPVSFSTTQNGWGSFAFSGDALTWSAANVTRGNLAAWYVCTGQQLFINTGAYLYGTPSGCYDETIHFYNGATAVA